MRTSRKPVKTRRFNPAAVRIGGGRNEALVVRSGAKAPTGLRAGAGQQSGSSAALLGDDPSQWTRGRLTHQLRRRHLHGFIERIEKTHRYTVTERGCRVALWRTRRQSRVLRPRWVTSCQTCTASTRPSARPSLRSTNISNNPSKTPASTTQLDAKT